MDVLYKVCCRIDVHKKKLVSCLKKKGKKDIIKEFGSGTKDIKELAEWLKKINVKKLLWKVRHHIGNLYGIYLKLKSTLVQCASCTLYVNINISYDKRK